MDSEILGLAEPAARQRLFGPQSDRGGFEIGEVGLVGESELVPKHRGTGNGVRIVPGRIALEGQDFVLR